MRGQDQDRSSPIPKKHTVYKELYTLYRQLHDAFGTKAWIGTLYNVMKDLLTIRDRELKKAHRDGLDMLERPQEKQVWQANLDLVRLRSGHADVRQRQRHRPEKGIMAIKPSGVSYEVMQSCGHRPRRPRGKGVEGKLKPVLGHADAPRALPGLPGHRRHRPCPQRIRDHVCPGLPAKSPAWGRRTPTISTARFRHPLPDRARKSKTTTKANTGKVIIERFAGLDRSRCRPCWWPATALSPGARRRPRRWRTAWPWKKSPKWRS